MGGYPPFSSVYFKFDFKIEKCSDVCCAFPRASRAKLQRLEKETRELEKSIEALRHYQAKCGELEKMNKKLQSQAHTDRREIIRLKEEVQGSRSKVTRLEIQQSEMKSQEERLEDIDGASTRKMMVSAPGHIVAHTGRYTMY